MKNKQPMPWLLIILIILIILIGVHGFIALQTMPEFHVLDQDELARTLDEVKMQTMSAQELRKILILAHWCDANGTQLGMDTLIIDAAMFVIVAILLKQCVMAE